MIKPTRDYRASVIKDPSNTLAMNLKLYFLLSDQFGLEPPPFLGSKTFKSQKRDDELANKPRERRSYTKTAAS